MAPGNGTPPTPGSQEWLSPTQNGRDGGREGAKGTLLPEGSLVPQRVIMAMSQQPQGQEGVRRGEPG